MASFTVLNGHTVMLKIPNGEVKSAKLEAGGTVTLGRFGSFFADQLIGKTYGKRFEIQDKLLHEIAPVAVQEIEETDATNELIIDDGMVQPLSTEEIEALKSSGVHVSEIIKKQTEQHAAFKLKNEYSKEKYKKRKEAKFSKNFTVIEPTLHNVSEYWFFKDRSRIHDLRSDTLSQMLNLVNVHPGGRYLVVDEVSGLLVAGVLEKLGGSGRLLAICDVDGLPAYPATTQMNFPPASTALLSSLNWATADEEYVPAMLQSEPPKEGVNDRHQTRVNKRKAATGTLTALREELFSGEFDGLLVASQYEPLSVLEKLEPYLAGSASVAVYSPHIQVVTELQSTLRDVPHWLGPAVTESWLRQYQVLPGRTHPMMNTSGSGGFLLHAIKIYDDPAASSVMAHRVKKRKAQTISSAPADSITPGSTEHADEAPAE